ncbi:TonB family protein, partial [Salmonella enterica subsp. enterica]|nr:TonB family protein [Salmonella enterica subsp. enterica serovar Enteritidis]
PKNPAEDVRPKTPERRAAPAPQVKPASRVAPPSPTRKSAQERPHKPTGDGRAAAPARKAQTDGSGKSPATSGKSATPGQRAPAGRASGNSNGAGQAGKASAAVSAYPGLVQRRIQRSAANQGVGASGTVSIALTIAANGGVSGVRIAKPSGNPAMDQAALRAVRRAAPFPAIPKDAGRSTWSFVVPVIFSQR